MVHVGEPTLRPSGLRTQRLTLDAERTLRGERSSTFAIDTVRAQQNAPAPGPGRYLLASSTTQEHITLWATIDVAPNAPLPDENALRAELDQLCEHAERWPDGPFERVEP